MVVHQVLCKGTQGSEALIRDTLRPEDNPLKENQRHRACPVNDYIQQQLGNNYHSTKTTTDQRTRTNHPVLQHQLLFLNNNLIVRFMLKTIAYQNQCPG